MILSGSSQSIIATLGSVPITALSFVSSFESEGTDSSGSNNYGTLVTSGVDYSIVPAPASSEALEVCNIAIFNNDNSDNVVSLYLKIGSTKYKFVSADLAPGDSLHYTGGSFEVLDSDGAAKASFTGLWTLEDGDNVILGTATGSKIGTATTQKLGFWNATPIVQPAGAGQAAVITTAATQTTPYGFATQAQADSIVTLANALRTALVNAGLIKGAA